MHRLKAEREKRKLTAYQLADFADTKESRIYSMERGRLRPRAEEARALGTVLGVDVGELFPDGTQRPKGGQS